MGANRDYRYIARFCLDDIACQCEVPCVADIKLGFWINENMEFTQGEDAAWWIPPGQLIYVFKERIQQPDEEEIISE